MCSSGSFINNPKNTSSSSLNSSYIWREASPNSFNVYSASVSSLNTSYRYSLGTNTGSPEWRAMSEEKASPSKRSFMNHVKQKTVSNYENVYCAKPLLPIRKNKQTQHVKIWKNSAQPMLRQDSPPLLSNATTSTAGMGMRDYLYDRRTNRSFESPHEQLKTGPMRRSTPHLAGDDLQPDNTSRHSATWCCGNFMKKQWRKMNNYD